MSIYFILFIFQVISKKRQLFTEPCLDWVLEAQKWIKDLF